ncbi:hypothetical protein ES708_30211 [subsurface metagenome]
MIAAGPATMTITAGKINNTIGKINLTAIFSAFSSAIKVLSSHIEAAKTLNVSAMLVPKRSVCVKIVANEDNSFTLPIILFFVLNAISPQYMEPFRTTTIGRYMLLAIIVSVSLGYWVMKKLAVLRY